MMLSSSGNCISFISINHSCLLQIANFQNSRIKIVNIYPIFVYLLSVSCEPLCYPQALKENLHQNDHEKLIVCDYIDEYPTQWSKMLLASGEIGEIRALLSTQLNSTS